MCERFFFYKVEIFLRFCIFYLLWIRFYLFVYVDKYLENIFLIFINLKLFKIMLGYYKEGVIFLYFMF